MDTIDARDLHRYLKDMEHTALSNARLGRISAEEAAATVTATGKIAEEFLPPFPRTLADMEPEEAAGYLGKEVSIIDYPETGGHMVLAIRGNVAMILMHHRARTWPSTDIWPLDELIPMEPGQEQDPKAPGPRSYPQAGQAGYRPPHNPG